MSQSRSIKRDQFDLSLQIKKDDFIETRDPSQQNWTIVRALEELADDLAHLDEVSKRFVDGSRRREIVEKWGQ